MTFQKQQAFQIKKKIRFIDSKIHADLVTKSVITTTIDCEYADKLKLDFLLGKYYFSNGSSQNYLIFLPLPELLTLNIALSGNTYVDTYKIIGYKSVKLPGIILTPNISYSFEAEVYLKYNNSVLEQKRLSFPCKKIINSYIVYKLNNCPTNPGNNFTTKKCSL